MPQLTVRNVPDDIVEELRQEASASGRSMNAVVRDALREHAEKRQWRERAQRALPRMVARHASIKERNGGPLADSWPLIREDRDR